MKRIHELERLPPIQRRRFLKWMGAALGAMGVDAGARFAFDEVGGGKAYAQSALEKQPTYFVEINLRDQWDQGHVMVAPGLATFTNLRRGDRGDRAALFFGGDELRKYTVNGTDVYLTADSADLQPHLDHIAMVDCCEVGQGQIHGHESANPLRSPGRSYTQSAGKMPMFNLDPVSNFPQGCEAYYSSTPTPASLHNFRQKQIDPTLRNGIAIKGIGRTIHTAYHFAGNLRNAELDRIPSVATLHSAFPDKLEDLRILPSSQEADAFLKILDRVDNRFLQSRNFSSAAQENHVATLQESKGVLYKSEPRLISLPLTEAERTTFSAGVPPRGGGDAPKPHLWEQMAYATKIITNDLARSVALEFDYVDLHEIRGENDLRAQAKQISMPLARMIQAFKDAGIFDRTLIAVYCTDGSRSPAAGSYGDSGKNTVILAGGMIRGGYFGDVRVLNNQGDGHTYSYHAPDLTTGAPGVGVPGNGGRVPGAAVWRTVAKALRIPDELAGSFPDVASGATMRFALRS